jgi:signal transduction histidine kinase
VQAAIVPIPSNNPHPAGVMVVGLSARLQLDQAYRDFIDLMKTQISAAVAKARAYEEERKRAEALAQLDRAKTAFFSNVSHEFRTPLTLMLGPIEDLLTSNQPGLSLEAKEQLELANRNGLRLLRLVNTLLDFSRIEAGRVQAVFEPTDLSAFTRELGSVFRSAIEKAGLRLNLDCPALPEPVYVDRDMWEKMVLNLISNAFKFTFEGQIGVSLGAVENMAELRVQDTGVGIPPEEIPKIFERFHRVTNARSRTHEGSGIGLALVQELVKLHGGNVRVESQIGRGATFIIRVPLGKEHLPPERIGASRNLASTAVGAAPFVEEALSWLPHDTDNTTSIEVPSQNEPLVTSFLRKTNGEACPRILIADDNADMRQYVARLLSERYEVETVADGETALATARERRPDLILSDIMMPHLDGVGLLQELRRDPELKTVPVILLSARACEESRVEGLQEGADDYLIKPFSARELLARVAAHVEMANLRKQKKEELELLVVERTAKLQEMVNELEHFSYTITHDMRAPLRAMRGFAEVLREDYRDLEGPEQRTFLERIITAAARMDTLIIDALSYSKAVRQELRLEPVDVGKLVREMVDSYPEFQNSQAHILVENDLPVVLGNEAGLTQCFSNLLGNAVKFVEPGKRPCVRVRGELRGDWVRLWVEDNGTGISERMLPRIFDLFSRGASPQAGTGVGLALVRKTATRMGGKVGVESQRGQGSRFWLELKLAYPA